MSGTRLYGNWLEVRGFRLFGFNVVGAVSLGVGFAILVGSATFGRFDKGFLMMGLFAAVAVFAGTGAGEWIARRVKFAAAKFGRVNVFRSGVFARQASLRSRRLPGGMGSMTLKQATYYGSAFAVVEAAGRVSVVVECTPEGTFMREREEVDHWVSSWGGLLASMSKDASLACLKAIVCSRPATATTLEEEARSARVSDSPALARQVIDALARDLPRAASENTVWVEATFEKSGLGKKEEEITEALAQRLTQLEAGLLACGAGDTRRVDAASLVEMVRNSFDPAWPVSIPRDGSVSVEEMWREVGPVAYEEAWKSLHHDSAYSQSWEMSEAPRSAITSQSLFPLLSADKMIPRKRVALIFRPYSRARSQKVAESQTSTRVFDANSSRRKQVSPSARHDANVAQRAAEAVTLGASMVRFSVVVTISVDKAEDLDRASAIVREASGAVPVTIRPSYGSQAPAFATTLPIGFLPWHSGKIRTRLQEAAS